jgi:hypothetical protein
MRSDLVTAIDGDVPRGAVGAFDKCGKVLYGYPESAGYWLQWASSRADVSPLEGERVVGWLADTQLARGGWPTRTARDGLDDTTTSYLFDHAMIWHGLRCWANQRRSGTAHQLQVAALAATERFIVSGELVAGFGPMPSRWSARAGPFLLKACARLRGAIGPIGAACARAMPTLVQRGISSPHIEAHPQLYAIEGLLMTGHAAEARRAFGDLCVRGGGIHGIRESTLGGPRRSDVLAQVLRAGLTLGMASREDPAWAELAGELLGRIDENGRVAFSDGDEQCPTWVALFCEQALTFWQGEPLAAEGMV